MLPLKETLNGVGGGGNFAPPIFNPSKKVWYYLINYWLNIKFTKGWESLRYSLNFTLIYRIRYIVYVGISNAWDTMNRF